METRDPPPNDGAGGVTILEIQLDPDGLDGDLDYDQIRKITSELIEWPDELSPKTSETDLDTLEVLWPEP